jgi:aminopeptidase N
MLLNNSAMLARAGLESLADSLRLLAAYEAESSEPVWDVMSLILADARRFIDHDETIEPQIKELIRTLITKEYARLGWDESAEDSAADQKLRATIIGLGAYAEEPDILEKSKRMFDDFKKDNASVSAELRAIALTVAVKYEYDGALEYLIDLYGKTNSSDLQRDIAGSLTATRSPEEAERLLQLIKDPELVKPQDADRWLFYLLRNRYVKELAWDWMVHKWHWIEATYQNDKSYDYFPRYAAAVCSTRPQQAKYLEFFQPKLDQPILKRNIAIGIEEIENRLRWLERDLPAVQQFFASK